MADRVDFSDDCKVGLSAAQTEVPGDVGSRPYPLHVCYNHGYRYPVLLDSFRCAAHDLARYRLKSESMWLRREDDSDDPGTWCLVRTVRYVTFGSIYDPGLQGIKLLAVSFDGETPEVVLNQAEQVEFAIPRHVRLPES